MKKLSLITLLLFALVSACGVEENKDITITGDIQGLGNDPILLYGIDQYYDRIDTIQVRDGKFETVLHADTLVDARLQFKDGTIYPIYLNKGDDISIKGQAAELQALEITGNQPNKEYTSYQKEIKEMKQPSEKELADKAETFIKNHPFSLVSIYLLDRYFVQKPTIDYQEIEKLISNMSGELKDRPYISDLQEKLKAEGKADIGRNIPYFKLSNIKGKKIGRADYKGKYLLIHFWASWDSLSRQQNAMYRHIYDKLKKNKHFAQMSISLDLDKTAWETCIKQDTLKWEQLCDFNGWETDVVKQLSVRKLPCNFLLTPSGVIEAKDIDENTLLQRMKEIEKEAKDKK